MKLQAANIKRRLQRDCHQDPKIEGNLQRKVKKILTIISSIKMGVLIIAISLTLTNLIGKRKTIYMTSNPSSSLRI